MPEQPFLLDNDRSAVRTFTHWQATAIIAALLLMTGWLLFFSDKALSSVIIAFSIFNLAFLLYRLVLITAAYARNREMPVADADIEAARQSELPFYSILIPLYREGEVLPQLVGALNALDYPKERMEVLLLLEEDDRETLQAYAAMHLPPRFKKISIPDVGPRTKPKACCYGLTECRGDLVVIYDAEDMPEQDQLLKAVAAFKRAEASVICLQAKLNYYNRTQNWLTRLFTMEYSMWFDLFLPGLMALDAPIPLGGTSNHFRKKELVELGGWDPFNVTEDCDLGVRLYLAGYRTGIIPSTTWEEANSRPGNWLRQRSRWVKGYIQTYLVHMRHPLAVLRNLGWKDMLHLQLTLAGMFFSFLFNPLGWMAMLLWHISPDLGDMHLFNYFPGLRTLNFFALTAGNALFILMMALGTLRRGYRELLPWLILVPLYWLMMSLGAYKAVVQLIHKPHFWEKTEHGLFDPLAGYISFWKEDRIRRRETYAKNSKE